MTAKIKIYAKAYEETVDLSLVTEKCVSYDFVYSGQHLGERKLTVEVESPIEIEFAIGDFAFLDLYGSSEKFFLHAIPIGNRVHNSLMVKYSLTFWWRGYELKTIAFLDYVDGNESADAYNRNTGEVYVTGTIVQLMDRIKANMGRAYADGWYGTWDYDIHTSVDDTITKDISLENQYCWDALLLVKSLFGIDYRFSYDDRVILVGHPPEQVYDDYNSENLNFQFGKDKGLCEITRLENTEQLVTRVFAYGSTRNISPTYRSADFEHGYSPRLMLPAIEAPNGYLSNAGLEAIYGIREAFYINDEIYPSIEGLDNTIKAVDVINDRPDGYSGYKPQYETVIVKEEENYDYYDAEYDQHVYIHIPQEVKKVLIPTENFDIFTVYISGTLPNITNENINAGKTAKMLFTTGLLAGNTFEITSYEEHMTLIDGQPMWNDGFGNQYYKVTLKRINNDDNYFLPNGTIKPSAGDETTPGDKFVFVDIFMPVDYEAAAEYALYEDTLNWLAQHSGIPMAYFIRIPEEFIERYINIQYWLRESVLAKITDTILNADATYLIQSITISWKKENLLPTYDLTLADKPIKSRIHLLESNLKSASAVAATNNYNTNKQISNMEKSATINFNRVFNNNWDINGNYIAPQSVQINSQSIELKSTRYILQAYFTVNYLGNANSARGTEGVLIHKDADVVWGGIYDLEHQTWTIAAPQTFTLETEKYYWVYIKCSLVNGSAIWVVSEIKILAQELEGYYMFEWGQINPSIGDYRFSQNEHGINGIDSFVYIAYGSSITGADFTMVNNPALEYMAIKSTTSVIVTPVVDDFDGLWFKRKGDAGGGGGTEYEWNIHSPEQIIGYLDEPDNIVALPDGTGAIDETIAEGAIAITAINTAGETLATDCPTFDILVDSTEAVISWDAVIGATGYRVYYGGSYLETVLLSVDFLDFVPDTLADLPLENTAAIFQNQFTIDNEDTVQVVGSGIDIETEVDDLDATKKILRLKKQQSSWLVTDVDSPNYIPGKPTSLDGREVELSTDSGYIVWRYVGEVDWINLVSLATLKGDNGTEIELRENAGWVEWRYVGGSWAQLYEIPIPAADNAIKVAIDFVDAGELEFVYNCPVALKFTSQESEGADAVISPVLNTDLAQYDKVTITAAEVGLIVLNGITL